MSRNLGDLVTETAGRFDRRVAFQIRRGLRTDRVTYRTAGLSALRLATWFRERGLEPGDRVVAWAPNMPEYAVLFFGSWLAGITIVPIDVRTPQDVLGRLVAAARPRIGFKSRLLEGAFGEPVAETFAMEEMLDLVRNSPAQRPAVEVGPDDTAEIVFTSGTTGFPKGVVITHGNLLSATAAMGQMVSLSSRDRALSVLPLSHVLEQTIGFLLPFSKGVPITYLLRENAATIARTMREERTTCMVLVPEALRMMMARIEQEARAQGQWQRWELAHRLAEHLPVPLRRALFRQVHEQLGGRLRLLGCGGAPLDPRLAEAWERLGIEIIQGYGLTETTGACTCNSHDAKRLDSVGRPLRGVEVRIGDEGEILVRGPIVTPGYFEQPEKTAESFADGWFRTGDAGEIVAEGFLRITGRQSSRIILPDGRNVYPEDVERVLNANPDVRDSCVIPVRSERGETVHAVLLTSAPERSAEIVREANRALASHQQIAGFTIWPEHDVPRTAVLKPDRRKIREAVERGTGAVEAAAAAVAAEQPAADPLVDVIARVAERPAGAVTESADLGTDLGLDSLARIELLAAIEEELGQTADEMQVTPWMTVGELRSLLRKGEEAGRGPPRIRWARAWWARLAGYVLQWLAFRIQDAWARVEFVHRERAFGLPFPSLLIFNYQGPYAPLLMLRALPPHLRSRVAVAVDSRLWKGRERWQGMLLSTAVQAFPFEKSGGAVRASLEETARWLEAGYAVVISPEGDPEERGELLPFLEGTGLMAVEMGVPMVPFRIEGYWRLFDEKPPFPFLPSRKGRVRVIVGEPVQVPSGASYAEATAIARRALVEAR